MSDSVHEISSVRKSGISVAFQEKKTFENSNTLKVFYYFLQKALF